MDPPTPLIQLHIQKLHPAATIPRYIRQGDAALDLYACEKLTIAAGGHTLVPTGIAMAIPHGFVGLIWDRSGIAAKNIVKTMGGVIDSNYRGEIKVIMHNHADVPFEIEVGTRVAQMVIQRVEQMETVEVSSLDTNTVRGVDGFGSSGK